MTHKGSHPWLIVREPGIDTIAQTLCHGAGIVGEVLADLTPGPAALILEGLRQVIVEEAGIRLNAAPEQLIHQLVIKGQAIPIDTTSPLRQDAAPGGGETVSLDTEVSHQGDIFLPAVVVICGNIAVFI